MNRNKDFAKYINYVKLLSYTLSETGRTDAEVEQKTPHHLTDARHLPAAAISAVTCSQLLRQCDWVTDPEINHSNWSRSLYDNHYGDTNGWIQFAVGDEAPA